MTSSDMGRRYIEEANGRVELVRLAQERGLRATVVREAQEAVELFLKGALRVAAVEPMRTYDVAELLRREEARFPAWFRTEIPALASISTQMAGDRGIASYGDERQEIAPQDLFDAKDANRAPYAISSTSPGCAPACSRPSPLSPTIRDRRRATLVPPASHDESLPRSTALLAVCPGARGGASARRVNRMQRGA